MKRKVNNILLKLTDRILSVIDLYEQTYRLSNKRTVLKEIRKQDDLFMTMILSEQLGVENPVIWHMLELYPFLLDQMHEWHTRMGIEKCHFEGLKCC